MSGGAKYARLKSYQSHSLRLFWREILQFYNMMTAWKIVRKIVSAIDLNIVHKIVNKIV